MLHRSFKPAKCKTALKLAVSRIKLLNNKREAQLKQIKRELAQLLESGQVQTARIRVEHVVREEKALTAYNLVEIYCELIAARLPIIESQKNCPIDLKEAITSVIFATPRCSDVPELADIKKHFTTKYGKEFITKAIELRPDCGVNRMLVEKLSTKSPDGQTKLKILIAIAEEHNVKWDPASFSESDPKASQDLLNGPNTFEMASKIYTEAPPVPARSNQYDKGGTPNTEVSPKHDEKSDVHVNFNAQNTRPSSGSQNFASSGFSPNNATTSASFHPEERSSGTGTEWNEQKRSFPRNENDSLGRQDWNMQFKDATSAAQAAAESAERASLAARAAAELSRQHSSESPRPYGHSPKDEAPQVYTGSKLQSDPVSKVRENNAFYQRDSERRDGHIVDKGQEVRLQSSESQKSEAQIYAGSKFQSDHVSKDAEDKAFCPRNSGTRDEHIVEKGREEQESPAQRLVRDGHNKNDRYSNEASIKFSTVSTQDASSADSFQTVDKYFHKKSSKSFENDFVDEFSKKNHFGEAQSVVDIHDSMESEETVYFDDRVTRKQSSTVSCRSHSSSFSDDQEKVLRKNDDVAYSEDKKPAKQPSRASSRTNSSASVDIHADIFERNDESEDPFVRDDSSLYRHNSETNFNENTAAFDDYSSDDDNHKVDVLDYKEQETSLHFSSPVRKSSTNLLDDSAVWSPRRNTNEGLGKSASQSHPSVFSESSEVSSLPARPDDLPPAAFDDYDSPSSDSEEDLGKSKLTGSTDLHKVPSEKSAHSRRSELVQSEDKVVEDENVESWRSPWSRPSVVDSQPKQVLPDRSQRVKSTPVSEKKFDDHELPTVQPISRRMRSRLESTVKETEEFPDTTRDSELLNESTLNSGKELNFGSLTGGLRNKGNRRPPYIRKTSEATFPVKEAPSVNRSDVEQSSLPSPRVMPSIDPGTANQERYNDRASTKLNQKKSSWTFAKHGDSDDNHSEEEAQQESSITKQLHNQKSSTQQVKKPSSRDVTTYFDPDGSNSDEDVSKSSSPVTARPGAGLSRRTKPPSFKSGRTYTKTTVLSEEAVTPNFRAETRSSSSSSQVGETLPVSVGRPYSKTTVSSEENVAPNSGVESKSSSSSSNFGETLPKTTGISYLRTNAPSRESVTSSYRAESKPFSSSSNISESSPKLFSETKSSDHMGTWERRRLVEQDIPKQIPESRRSSRTDSLKSSTSEPKSNILPKSLESEKSETPSYRAESKSSASSVRVSEASPKPLWETKSSDQARIRERHRLVQNDTSKPTRESIRSSGTDSSKSLTSEQKPKSPPVGVKPDITEASNSPAVTRETSSKDTASHVHPNLPDSDSFTAFFQSLKQK